LTKEDDAKIWNVFQYDKAISLFPNSTI